jgi:predicted Fe-S protein YdhL (DUF1289 family)
MTARPPADYVASPCISVCVLDATGRFCLGCFRTLDEIAAWGTLDSASKRRIVAELPARKTSNGPR